MTVSTHIPESDSSIRGADQFTDDQLHFLRVSRKRAVHDALTRYVRGASVAFLLLFAAFGYNQYQRDRDLADRRADNAASKQQIVKSGNAVAVEGCNRDFATIKKLRGLIADGRPQVIQYGKDGTLNPIQVRRGLANIQRQLDSYPLPDCRKVAHVVSDNPKTPLRVPVPLYDRSKPNG